MGAIVVVRDPMARWRPPLVQTAAKPVQSASANTARARTWRQDTENLVRLLVPFIILACGISYAVAVKQPQIVHLSLLAATVIGLAVNRSFVCWVSNWGVEWKLGLGIACFFLVLPVFMDAPEGVAVLNDGDPGSFMNLLKHDCAARFRTLPLLSVCAILGGVFYGGWLYFFHRLSTVAMVFWMIVLVLVSPVLFLMARLAFAN